MKLTWKILLLPLLASLLIAAIACDSDDDEDELALEAIPEVFQVITTIPATGQFNSTLTTRVIAKFSFPLDAESVDGKVRVEKIVDGTPDGEANVTITPGESIITIAPEPMYEERTNYVAVFEAGIRSISGEETTDDTRVYFETGVRVPKLAERLSVTNVTPLEDDPCYEFHTFRVYFNEPVYRRSLWYGDAVRFVEKESGALIAGNLFGRGNVVVFDPDNDLTPGKTYQLIVTTQLSDLNGQTLEEDFVREFTPQTAGKITTLAMDQCPTQMAGYSFCPALPDAEIPTHSLTELKSNNMFANSALMGPTNINTGGRLWNEFGDSTIDPTRVPFVVRKGQIIKGLGIRGLLGGEIYTGLETGDFDIIILADAVGELLGSEYVHGVKGLPVAVHLTMDAVQIVADGSSSSVFAQPIYGVNLIGTGAVDDVFQVEDYQALQMDLAGFTEIQIINEYIPVTMSMHMAPPPVLPEQEYDEESIILRSVSPEPDSDSVLAGDEIILLFSRPIDPDTVRDNIRLVGPDGRVECEVDVYNPKIALTPLELLEPDTDYTIEIDAALADIRGKQYGLQESYAFHTMQKQSSMIQPPMLNASFPGMIDDSTLAANFTTNFFFSQNIERSSLVYGESFGLYDETAGGTLVPGTALYFALFVHFVPDQNLTVGNRYSWRINQNVTNTDGLALDTDRDRTPGGPEILVEFTATEITYATQSMLYTMPYADADNSGYLDGLEQPTATNNMDIDFPLIGDPSYTMGYMPITVYPLIQDDNGQPRVPIDIEGGSFLYASNTSISLDLGDKETSLLDMGRITIEMQDGSSSDLYPASDGLTGVDANTNLSFNVENEMMNDFIVHESNMVIPSRLRFSNDGRMMVYINGDTTIQMDIPIIGMVEMNTIVDMTVGTVPSRRAY